MSGRFNPYGETGGGSTVAIAGADFAILAGDTRQSTGYSIDTRQQTQIHELGDGLYITTNGFSADSVALIDDIRSRIKWYHHKHNKAMTASACARMMMHILYGKRFFPYYCQPILVGLQAGEGAVYSFDFVGSYEREASRASGHASSLLMPFLDNQVRLSNQLDPATGELRQRVPLERDAAVRLVKDAFTGAAERQIHVGDSLEIAIITKDGISKETYPLRRD